MICKMGERTNNEHTKEQSVRNEYIDLKEEMQSCKMDKNVTYDVTVMTFLN